jgi:hypothetical protein
LSQVDLFHGRLILGFKIAVESHVLINSQGLTPGMTGDQLKLGIRQAAMPGQPSDRLVPEGVRGRLDPSLFGVLGDNLLDPPGAELAVPLCLEVSPGASEPATYGRFKTSHPFRVVSVFNLTILDGSRFGSSVVLFGKR